MGRIENRWAKTIRHWRGIVTVQRIEIDLTYTSCCDAAAQAAVCCRLFYVSEYRPRVPETSDTEHILPIKQ